MTFQKPTIVELGSATEAIQFVGGSKTQPLAPDSDPSNTNFSTGDAYQMDE